MTGYSDLADLADGGPAQQEAPVRTRPSALFFIGTLSQTLTLRAAFASSTYLLSQIPGPGRSSDDDFVARGGNMISSRNFIAITTFFITFGGCAMQNFHFLLLFLHIVVF